MSSHVDIVDKFSPGETPRAGSVYTHKLDFEWDTAFHLFNRLPQGTGSATSKPRCRSTTSRQVCPRQAMSSAANDSWTRRARGRCRS